MTTGQALKEHGMDLAAMNRADILKTARQIALTKAHQNGTVTADDIPDDVRVSLGPAAGSIFKTGDFEFTGRRVTSVLASNHARELKVWKLTADGVIKVQKQADKVTRHSPGTFSQSAPQHIPQPSALPSWLK